MSNEPAFHVHPLDTTSEGNVMGIEQWDGRRLYRLATWSFVIAAVALWLPLSWGKAPNRPGTHLSVDFGVLKPLRATWQSSADGFWFAFSDVRGVALVLTIVLTAAALIAARETARREGGPRTDGPGSGASRERSGPAWD